MGKLVKTQKMNAIETMAARLNASPEELQKTLKATAFKECKTDEEFAAAVIVANQYHLNPFLKQIYAFPTKGGGVCPMVPIDGWIQIVQSDKRYNGVKFKDNLNADGDIESITVLFYLKDTEFPVEVTEYMKECRDNSKGTWVRWPIRMLRHKAYCQGARVAFGIAGIYDEDEAQRIGESIEEKESHLKPVVDMPKELAAPAVDPIGNTDIVPPVDDSSAALITLAQQKELVGLCKTAKISEAKLTEVIKKHTGKDRRSQLTEDELLDIIEWIHDYEQTNR